MGATRETGLIGERPPDAPECIPLTNGRPRASSASGMSVREAICRRSPGDDARLVLAPVCAPCPDRSKEPLGRVRGDPVARTRPGTRAATKNVVSQDICEYPGDSGPENVRPPPPAARRRGPVSRQSSLGYDSWGRAPCYFAVVLGFDRLATAIGPRAILQTRARNSFVHNWVPRDDINVRHRTQYQYLLRT